MCLERGPATLYSSGDWASPMVQIVKNPFAMCETGFDLCGSGRSPGEGKGNPLQYSCLENPMDRGAWRDTVHGVAKIWTQQAITFTFFCYSNDN